MNCEKDQVRMKKQNEGLQRLGTYRCCHELGTLKGRPGPKRTGEKKQEKLRKEKWGYDVKSFGGGKKDLQVGWHVFGL